MKSIIFSLLICSSLTAQSAGTSGLSFLKIGFGARNIALADNGSALANDVTSAFYNPANLSGTFGNEIMILHNEWIGDVSSEMGAVKFHVAGLPLAIGFISTTIPDIEIREIAGAPVSKFNAHFSAIFAASVYEITPELFTGASIKYLYEGIYADEAAGFGFDFGLTYFTPIQNLKTIFALRNFGSLSKLKNESTKLPTEVRAGAGYKYSLFEYNIEFFPAVEFQKYFSADDAHINLAVETVYDRLFALRLGYQLFYDSKGFTTGVGLNWGGLSFDYALVPFNYSLGAGHVVSLNLRF